MNKTNANPTCQSAELYYYDYLHGYKDDIPETVSNHIVDCPDCLNEIQWLTQVVAGPEDNSQQNTNPISHVRQIQLHCNLIGQAVSCSTIRSFLPILATPGMGVQISTPVTDHIKECPDCARDLETLKQLNLSPEQLGGLSQIFSQKYTEDVDGTQSTTDSFFRDTKESSIVIRKIMDRPDSGIITTFQDISAMELTQEPHVDVTNGASMSNATPSINSQPTTKQVANISRRRFFRRVAAAAAILIVTVLLFQSPSLKATDIGEIYAALKNVQNIMMAQYDVNIEEPVQTTYISNSLGIKLFETSGNFTLYDIKNKTQKTRTGLVSQTQQTNIDHEMAQAIAGSMDVPWGLLPFKKDSDLPNGAAWQKVQPAQTDAISGQTEIFDLFWSTEAADGKNIHYQWRCYLDAETKRPFKVEWRQKNQQNQDYELITFTEISYPTENQVKKVIEETGL